MPSIQARIEELQHTIAEKEEQIQTRAQQLKKNIEAELSLLEFIRKHPFKAAVTSFSTGFLLAMVVKKRKKKCNPVPQDSCIIMENPSLKSQNNSALNTIGLDVLRSVKDLGFTYLQRYIDKKIK
ncbi:MAG: hypothetical protein WCK32_09340 [Chlorobiaceae bacterium]